MKTDAKINTGVFYSGDIELQIKINDQIIQVKQHNNGTDYLKKAFAKFLVGKQEAWDIPRIFDLRKSTNDWVTWESALTGTLFITSRIFERDTSGWCATFTVALPYTQLKESIDSNSNGSFRCYLTSSKDSSQGATEDYHDLAYVSITQEDLARITPGSQALITWRMRVLNISDLSQ